MSAWKPRGVYREAVAEHLAWFGHTVSGVNPFQIKSLASSGLTRSQTDKGKARRMAGFCAERHPDPGHAPSDSEQALKARGLRLDALQAMRTQEGKRLDVARAAVRNGMVQHIDGLDEQLKALTKTIRQHVTQQSEI
jgi:transposase